MQREVREPVGHFLALDHEELLVGAVERVEAVDARQEVVIGEHQELIPVLPIPAHDVVRRAVAVAVQRVRVRVALVPARTLTASVHAEPDRDGEYGDDRYREESERRASHQFTNSLTLNSHVLSEPGLPVIVDASSVSRYSPAGNVRSGRSIVKSIERSVDTTLLVRHDDAGGVRPCRGRRR